MAESEPVRVVLLTPEGRGAVATLLVSGPGATQLVGGVFRTAAGRPLDEFPLGRIVYGRFIEPEHNGEELIVCRRTKDEVEVHCHGGAAAAARIIEALTAAGAVPIDWRRWLDRPGGDAIAAAATIALAEAPTQRTAAILLDQLHGALRREIERIAAALVQGKSEVARSGLETLLTRSHIGLHLTTPYRVVVAGRPNVGKSSLINALVGYRRAIVFDQPGTTRDVVTAMTAIDGWPVELADTAGLCDSGDMIERAGVERAIQRMRAADAIVLVFDSSVPWSDEDAKLAAEWPTAIFVYSKCDLPQAIGPPPLVGIATSAVSGHGIEGLLDELAARLVPDAPPPGAAVPFAREQVAQLQAALDATTCGGAAVAAEVLARFGRRE